MVQINLQQTEFRNESERRSYLVSLVLEYASTMNRIEMEIFLKQEAGGISTSDLFEEYEKKYLPVFTAYCSEKKRVYGGRASSFGCPTKFDGIEKYIEANVVFKNSNRAEVYFKTENDFEEGIRQTENGAFLDGNRRPDAEIRFRTGFYRFFSASFPRRREDFLART